jgi:surfeit locus 1 family protein
MFRPLPGLTGATLVALAILLTLGTWQLQRRAEKHLLLAQIASRQAAPPAPIEILLPTGDYAAFRKAIAVGQFDHAREVYVFAARTDRGPTQSGFKVITPFNLFSGDTIMVDRGWVAKNQRDPQTRLQGQPPEQIEIEGVLQRPAKPSAFTPQPDDRIFYARNSTAIAKALAITLKTPLIFEAISRSAGGPEPLASITTIPDNHLSYAITWYGLALVLIVIYLRFHFIQGRLKFRP